MMHRRREELRGIALRPALAHCSAQGDVHEGRSVRESVTDPRGGMGTTSKLAAALALFTACGAGASASAHGHPVPAPTPRPYESIGSIDVGTLENTIFWWHNNTYVLENIGCGYGKLPTVPPRNDPQSTVRLVSRHSLRASISVWCRCADPHTAQRQRRMRGAGSADHAGAWFPEYANHSYARVRDFITGTVVANISTSIGFGFVNAFPDYDHDRLWLFGTPADRCHGNCGACTGAACPGRPSCTSIQSWWTSESVPTKFDTAVAIPAGTKDLPHTYNQVGGLPQAATQVD